MGNNPSRPGGLPSRHRHPQDRAFPKRAFSTRDRRQDYYRDYYDDDGREGDYISQDPHAPGFMPQGYHVPPQFMNGQHLVFPQPQMQAGMNPVVPGMPINGAIPTTGNPFPTAPMNMPVPETAPPPNPDAPVIPPLPSSRWRAGTPYVPPGQPFDSPSSDEYGDELTAEARERLQPPLAPGQYGPFDRMRDRTPRPALRQPGAHRRAASSPMFGRGPSPSFDDSPEPPVVPSHFHEGPPFAQAHPQQPNHGFFQPEMQMPVPEPEPEPMIRPRPFPPIPMGHNPLPPPPRDIFESSPYARLLRELRKPIDDIAIKERMVTAPAFHTVGAVNVAPPGGHHHGMRSSKEKKRKGLFRSFSTRLTGRKASEDDPGVASPDGGIPIHNLVGGQSTAMYPVVQHMPDGTTMLIYNPPGAQGIPGLAGIAANVATTAGAVPPPGVMQGYVPAAGPAVGANPPPPVIPPGTQYTHARSASPRHARSPSPRHARPSSPRPGHARSPSPIPIARSPPAQGGGPSFAPGLGSGNGNGARTPTPQPAPRPAIKIDRRTELAGLLHVSPHRVHYDHKPYPTGAHLLEALKFLPAHPEMAELVRNCGTPEEARAVAEGMRPHWNLEWERDMVGAMEEVLYHKFMQHSHLRGLLMRTGHADLVFSDPDTVWGDGQLGQGLNYLGRALVNVRERFRSEGLEP